ncbi:type 4a pilus biogenesis protein PilO [Methylotenera sp.]|uniref:type 4a pilus biogenesis protein PilO n=1 Tax=Methylotenera sp. TaxID=2051956 RepID=UPI002488AB06|nr:type 4a pilus biogenesis protein PilO [Methylotenera sp.]MDI1361635.1 type 4a pilus biogenesis protein PilO [Methylotenera sp.]
MESLNLALRPNHLVQVFKYKVRQLFWQTLGWKGLAGLLLIIGSVSYLIIVAAPKAQQLQQLQMKVAAVKANPKHNVSNRTNNDTSDITRIFYDVLPTQTEASSKISEILRVATDNGLVINKVEYEQPLSVSPLIQYQIKLPLTGSYMQIRQFINQVLNNLPSIALNDISFKREDIVTDLVDAQVQFTLYLQKAQQ